MKRSVCDSCKRPRPVCYCHLLTPLANRWPVVILQHVHEEKHALNTARIAQSCLQQCMTLRVEDGTLISAAGDLPLDAGVSPALIYPGEGSRPLEELATMEPVPLLFIDASWRKSRRLLLQSPWLQSLPRYALVPDAPARYRIRKEPRADYRSTLEAIVQVLGELETCPVADMLTIMDWVIDKQIAAMGTDIYAQNYPEQHPG